MRGEHGDRTTARIAALTGLSDWHVQAFAEPRAGRPPRLLWAADSQRLIDLIRVAYLAEQVSADDAWRLIERAAQPGTGLFSSWDDYWADVRVGVAFVSDRLEAVGEFDEILAALRASAWPAAQVPFPAGPVPALLPSWAVPGPGDAGHR